MGDLYVLNGVSLAAAKCSQIQNANIALNNQILHGFASGHVAPFFKSIRSQRPTISWGTAQLRLILATAAIGQYGKSYAGSNVDLEFRRVVKYGTREAINTSKHVQFRAANSLVHWSSISASQDGEASMALTCTPVSVSGASPIAYAGSQLATVVPAANEYFTLGPLYINGTLIDGLQQGTLNLNPSLLLRSENGLIWATSVAIRQIQPMLSFTGDEMTALWANGTLGASVGTGFKWFLRRRQANGALYADNQPQHLAISGTVGAVYNNTSSGTLADVASTGFQIEPVAADSNTDPLTLEYDQAIAAP